MKFRNKIYPAFLFPFSIFRTSKCVVPKQFVHMVYMGNLLASGNHMCVHLTLGYTDIWLLSGFINVHRYFWRFVF